MQLSVKDLSVVFCKCVISPGVPDFSTNKTDNHDITKILLKVRLNTLNSNPCLSSGINFALNQTLVRLSFFTIHTHSKLAYSCYVVGITLNRIGGIAV